LSECLKKQYLLDDIQFVIDDMLAGNAAFKAWVWVLTSVSLRLSNRVLRMNAQDTQTNLFGYADNGAGHNYTQVGGTSS
jgi:hypothetical protein